MTLPSAGMLIAGPEGEQTLRLEEVVGSGAFGDVWRAADASSGASYAVKFPRVNAMGSSNELTAFRNEVQAASKIHHPNVVPVLHVEAAPDEFPPYLVMEFVEGGTLRERLKKYRVTNELVPLDLIQSWAEGLVDGIAAINEHMLHRDLRPENILMKGDTPLIGDFGLSKVVGAITRSETFKGGQHVLYMAPEGWKLETNDIQLDMYAMGVVLFEIATLRYPYELPADVRDIGGMRDMHLYQQPESLRQARPDLPIGFSHLVTRLMEKNAQNRFADWPEAGLVLQKAWTADGGTAAGETRLVGELLAETQRRHDTVAKQQLEADERAAARAESRRLDLHQMERLIGDLNSAVTQYNQRSGLGIIGVDCDADRRHCWFKLPFAGSISLGFDWIDPPLNLRVGQVRFFGVVRHDDGAGFNYLLCRTDDLDLYGRWVVCHVSNSPLVRPSALPSRAPLFGLPLDEVREIEVADQAMHVYEVKLSEDVQDSFLEVALVAMRRATGS